MKERPTLNIKRERSLTSVKKFVEINHELLGITLRFDDFSEKNSSNPIRPD